MFLFQKSNTKTATQPQIRRTASPNRVTKEHHQETLEDSKITMTRTRSLRKSRDFDFSPEALLLSNNNNNVVTTLPSYTALLLEDIQNFHQKNVNINAISSSSMSKSCSTEAVSDLNSTTNQHQSTEVRFKSAAAKKGDLMEPSFEKYVTVKRGSCSLEDMEEQESSGSNSFVGTSPLGVNSGESSVRSKKQGRDRSPLGVSHEFDPLKKNGVGGLMQKSGGTC